ncbi:MAG: ABC transporter ATP-binding protein [Oscillospiraceae bacterium]|nr:ABC transporter ATP-binding protein [Oscillospiraceae bacterium]
MDKIAAIDALPVGEEILSMRNITKIYSNGFIANQDISFSIRKGEIHGLLGENGAGKTTLMKVLFGQEIAEEGEIFLAGEKTEISSTFQALDCGIGMVHQHFMLVDTLTVAENMVLGAEPRKMGVFFDLKKAIRMTEEIGEKYELPVDAKEITQNLSIGYKQRVEILKILLRGAKILILDEPTAVLTPQETKELFIQLKNLRDSGHTIIFISHKLDEVKEICDRITMLRHGKVVGAADIQDITEQEIANMMVGREIFMDIEKEVAQPKEPVLQISDISYMEPSGIMSLKEVSLTVRKGEILGVAGVEGNGQDRLADLIGGLRQVQVGDISINDMSVKGKSIREIRGTGTSLIHEDRMVYGAASLAPVLDNVISDRFFKTEYQNKGVLRRKENRKKVEGFVQEFSVKCDSIDAEVRTLSGGNIQKTVAAREFSSNPSFVLACHPTRGIDVGSTKLIRNKLIDLRDTEDSGILLFSADLNEILTVSDSIIVMYGGKIVAYFPDAQAVDEETLGEYMLGLKSQSPEEVRGVQHV